MKEALRLAQSLHLQVIEKMVVFGAFSRRSKADSAGFEKHDSSIGSAARRPAF
jgi:hypothetical protein